MRLDILYALILFCFVSGATPGPNNIMLMTSGVNFGIRRTLPHLLGVVLGFAVMVGVVGLGLDVLFAHAPRLLEVMRWAGAAYLLWLAYKIARSGPLRESAAERRPLGFIGAAAFQWVNPKGWAIAISALTAYAVSENYATSVATVAIVYLLIGLPSSGAWVVFGAGMRRVLADPARVKPFNWTMAALLVASILPLFWE